MAAVLVGLGFCVVVVTWCGHYRGTRPQGMVVVRDRSGAPLPAAQIRLQGQDTQSSSPCMATTDDNGEAWFAIYREHAAHLDVVCDGYERRRVTAEAFPIEVVLARLPR